MDAGGLEFASASAGCLHLKSCTRYWRLGADPYHGISNARDYFKLSDLLCFPSHLTRKIFPKAGFWVKERSNTLSELTTTTNTTTQKRGWHRDLADRDEDDFLNLPIHSYVMLVSLCASAGSTAHDRDTTELRIHEVESKDSPAWSIDFILNFKRVNWLLVFVFHTCREGYVEKVSEEGASLTPHRKSHALNSLWVSGTPQVSYLHHQMDSK